MINPSRPERPGDPRVYPLVLVACVIASELAVLYVAGRVFAELSLGLDQHRLAPTRVLARLASLVPHPLAALLWMFVACRTAGRALRWAARRFGTEIWTLVELLAVLAGMGIALTIVAGWLDFVTVCRVVF